MRTLLVLSLGLTASLCYAQDDGLSLYADFDGDLAADHSVGASTPTVNGQPRFIEGRLGQAVVISKDDWFGYPAEGNLNPGQGTVEFWLKPLDWDGTDDRGSHFFVGAAGKDRIYIYKFARWRHFTFHANPSRSPHYESLKAGIYQWPAGEWHHAAVTWDRAVMRIYLDGELEAEASIPAPIEDLGDMLYVGRDLATPQFTEGETALDELRVYSRPLFPEEVRRAYARVTDPDSVTQEPYRDLVVYYTGYPSENRADLAFVLSLAAPRDGAAALTITDPTTRREAIARDLTIEETGTLADCEIATAGLAPADYDLTVRITDGGGALVLEGTKKLVIRDKFWRGAGTGVPSEVPPPWTPLEVEGGTVRCWGREYRLDDSGVIASVESAGEPLLRRPLGLSVGLPGAHAEAISRWRLVERDDLHARLQWRHPLGGLDISQTATFEFDGFVRVDITITPMREGVQVERLAYEIPLRPEVAKYMQTSTQREKFYESGAIRDASWPAYQVYSIFVGDEDRGICLIQEGAAHWPNQDEETQLEVKVGQRETVLRANLITEPTTLAEPLTLSFGIQATPVRPMPEGWRTEWRVAPRVGVNPDPANAEEFGAKVAVIWWSERPDTPRWFAFPEPTDPEAFRALVDDFHARGIKVVVYENLTNASPNVPEAIEYSGEWFEVPRPAALPGPGEPARPARWLHTDLTHPDWTDCIVGYEAKVMAEYGVDGWYFDCAMPYGMDGVHPVFAYREACKRAYVAVKQRKPDGIIITHMSSHYMAPALSFSDAMLQGEQFRWPLPKWQVKDDYTQVLGLDYVLTELTGRNLGCIPVFLPEFPGSGHRNRRNSEHLIALTSLHDMLIWPIWTDPEPVRELWAGLDRFGVGNKDVQFLPHWEDPGPASSDSPEVLVSAYRRPGRALLIVSNFLGHDDRTVEVQANRELLGLTGEFDASDLLSGEQLPAGDGALRVALPEGRARLILLTPRP